MINNRDLFERHGAKLVSAPTRVNRVSQNSEWERKKNPAVTAISEEQEEDDEQGSETDIVTPMKHNFNYLGDIKEKDTSEFAEKYDNLYRESSQLWTAGKAADVAKDGPLTRKGNDDQITEA